MNSSSKLFQIVEDATSPFHFEMWFQQKQKRPIKWNVEMNPSNSQNSNNLIALLLQLANLYNQLLTSLLNFHKHKNPSSLKMKYLCSSGCHCLPTIQSHPKYVNHFRNILFIRNNFVVCCLVSDFLRCIENQFITYWRIYPFQWCNFADIL